MLIRSLKIMVCLFNYIKHIYNDKFSNKGSIIVSLRRQLKEAESQVSALEQENTLLEYKLQQKSKGTCLSSH